MSPLDPDAPEAVDGLGPALDRTLGVSVERAAAHLPEAVKPKLRGWLHLVAAPVAAVLGLTLLPLADGWAQVASVVVYAIATTGLFTVSATYHRGRWSPRVHHALRRADHSTIFVLIAGTYTPFAVLLLQGHQRGALLAIVWVAAAIGITVRVFWSRAPRWVFVPMYLALGWTAVLFLPSLLTSGGAAVLVLVTVGGVLYSVGAVVFALQRPDPYPAWFGFHEVFHALTLAAYLTQYAAVVLALLAAD